MEKRFVNQGVQLYILIVVFILCLCLFHTVIPISYINEGGSIGGFIALIILAFVLDVVMTILLIFKTEIVTVYEDRIVLKRFKKQIEIKYCNIDYIAGSSKLLYFGYVFIWVLGSNEQRIEIVKTKKRKDLLAYITEKACIDSTTSINIKITKSESELLQKIFKFSPDILKIENDNVEIKKIALNYVSDCIVDYFLKYGLDKKHEPTALGDELVSIHDKILTIIEYENWKLQDRFKAIKGQR